MEKNIEEFDEEIEGTGFNILDYLIILAKHKKLILSITLPFALIAFLLTIPKNTFYQAEISMLPPQQQRMSMSGDFVQQFGMFPGMLSNNYGKQELLVEIVKSKTFANKIIEKFKLKNIYGAKNIIETRNTLLANVRIVPDYTSPIPISFQGRSILTKIFVRDQNPQRAADIANGIVEELKAYVNDMTIADASRRKLFFEKQLEKSFVKLNEVEEAIKTFQEKNGISLVGNKINIAPDKFAPTLELEYKRLSRQLAFYEVMYSVLIKQYEVAKIDESKNAAVFQIIDAAIPPVEPNKMRVFGGKKALLTILTAFSFSCLLAFFKEQYKLSYKAKHGKKLETLMRHLSFKGKK